jgi:hypothetical protein
LLGELLGALGWLAVDTMIGAFFVAMIRGVFTWTR